MPNKGSKTRDKDYSPPVAGFLQDLEQQKREDDLYLISTVEKQVQGVLGELQYIKEMIDTHKSVAPVEDIQAKIRAAYQKIKAYSNSDITPEQMQELQNKQRFSSSVSVEPNPLVKEMGGMPLEVISAEWSAVVADNVIDKSELENIVNKKLKSRAELANKLKLKNKLKAHPKLRAGQALTPKFEKLKETLKYIMREMPAPRPEPKPEYIPPKPRPNQ